jgi:oligopeptide/dipeptide ABC transporter ATP-binding protein
MIKEQSSSTNKLLKVEGLKTYFRTFAGVVKALEGVNLEMVKGETLGLVGETGCGKSVTALSIIRLVPFPGQIIEGKIWFEGEDLAKISEQDLRRRIRGNKISMIFQEPMTSLNPVMKIGDQIAEVLMLHQNLDLEALEVKIDRLKSRKKLLEKWGLSFIARRIEEKIKKLEEMRENPPKASRRDKHKAAMKKVIEMLDLTGIPEPEKMVSRYPHELSGGMRQRVMISMALACNPALLMADEPTTALDVTIQAEIIDLMKELKERIGTSVLLITHNLGLVAELCDRVAVMYAGQIVEYGATRVLLKNPKHPYTKGLLASIPRLTEKREQLHTIFGSVPDLIYPPSGCRFHPRCEHAQEICKTEIPHLLEIENEHFVSCFLFQRPTNL